MQSLWTAEKKNNLKTHLVCVSTIKELFDIYKVTTYTAGTKLLEVIDLSIKVIGHD